MSRKDWAIAGMNTARRGKCDIIYMFLIADRSLFRLKDKI